MGIVNQYPYTDMHSINLDYIIKLCRENMGLHLEISGNQLILKTADGTIISSVTVHYAEEAGHASTATSATSAASATNATNAQNATYATNAAHASTADSATVAATANLATSATTAVSATNADYATSAGTAATATRATSAASADYAESTGSVEHANKAIETVTTTAGTLKFTDYEGNTIEVTVPYAASAAKDNAGNQIRKYYVANVVEGDNGEIIFKAADGTTIATITPTAASAASDTYGNTIADYVKTISAPNDSNYVTVSHGTGTAETITVNYSNQAWKDTNGNVIKNTYIKDLECVEDSNDGHYKLVAYNGDNPQAELFRTEIKAYSAQIADEATHAVTADTATTAATSTGSVSSIEHLRTILTINNGDGTSEALNLFRASKMYLYLKQDSGNTNLLDPSFTVGHSEEFTSDNYYVWGSSSAINVLNEFREGVWIYFFGIGSPIAKPGFRAQVYSVDEDLGTGIVNHFLITIFDYNSSTYKTFEFDYPADPVANPEKITVKRIA